jgi:hypothetical protein
MKVYVYNRSTVVADSEVTIIVQACNNFIKAFCAAWRMLPVHVTIITNPPTTQNYVFYIFDTDPADPLKTSYHTQVNNKIVGYIYANTILANGGAILYDGASTYTVAAAIFQEIIQTLINPYATTWWKMNSTTLAAAEICDPVHYNMVVVNAVVNGLTSRVALSDFVFPSWYDPMGPILVNPPLGVPQYNYKRTLSGPFTTAHCGFIITMAIGSGAISSLTNVTKNLPAKKSTEVINKAKRVIRK